MATDLVTGLWYLYQTRGTRLTRILDRVIVMSLEAKSEVLVCITGWNSYSNSRKSAARNLGKEINVRKWSYMKPI